MRTASGRRRSRSVATSTSARATPRRTRWPGRGSAPGYRGFSPDAPVYGSVDTVASKFRALAAMGYTDVIIRHIIDDQAKVLASYARLAEVKNAVASA